MTGVRPPVHFSFSGYGPTLCGRSDVTGLCGTPCPSDVTCPTCVALLPTLEEFDQREETDDELRARIKAAIAAWQPGPFFRSLIPVEPKRG